MAIKCANIFHSSIARPYKIYPNWNFWFESGNPGPYVEPNVGADSPGTARACAWEWPGGIRTRVFCSSGGCGVHATWKAEKHIVLLLCAPRFMGKITDQVKYPIQTLGAT
jgi:hypothetical protein